MGEVKESLLMSQILLALKKKKGKDIQLFLHRIQQVSPVLLGEGL